MEVQQIRRATVSQKDLIFVMSEHQHADPPPRDADSLRSDCINSIIIVFDVR